MTLEQEKTNFITDNATNISYDIELTLDEVKRYENGAKKRKAVDELLQEMIDMKKQQKVDKAKQHEEILKRLDTANALLEKLIDSIKTKEK